MRCAILDDYQRVALSYGDWESLRGDIEIVVFDRHFIDAELAVALAGFDIVVAMRERTGFPRAILQQLPRLRLLVTTGRWNPSIDVVAAEELGITVCSTGSVQHATAELTWGLILGWVKRIPAEDANLRAGGPWQLGVGVDLHGKTLGILGLGTLGKQSACIGAAFGMRVIAWSNNLTPQACEREGVGYVDRDGLLRGSDILTIHSQLSARTRGLIGAAELALMKPTALLVNTSRGPIVDEAALIYALERGTIAGAALDVFDSEPLPADHPLRRAPNTVLTPHLGYVSEDSYRVFFVDAVEDIRAWLSGRPIRVLRQEHQIDRTK